MWRAIAFRWIGAFVEPHDRRVDDDRILESGPRKDVGRLGVTVDHLDDAIARPVPHLLTIAMRGRSGRYPGRLIPSASASEFSVKAVPMVPQ